MKKFVIFFLLIFTVLLFIFPNKIEAKTLQDLYDELAELKVKKAEEDKNKENAEKEKITTNKGIISATNEIDECENKIEESRVKIEELNIEIKEKEEEIDNLMNFLQKSNNGNTYLEYIFGASTITEFIYRSAIVQQLTKHNDELISEMNNLIEENKALQIELNDKKEELEDLIETLNKKLYNINATLDDLDEIQVDLVDQIKAQEESIKYYEDAGCGLNQDTRDCISIPYSIGFTRPLGYGRISSNFGPRTDPVTKRPSYHRAVDIAGNAEGTPIYASAAGVVKARLVKASCGGNALYIEHNIKGVTYTSIYMHLLRFNVSVGDIVSTNTVIGYVGGRSTSTKYGGYDQCSTGAHLHFGIAEGQYGSLSYQDPRNYIYFPPKGYYYWFSRFY